MKKEEPEKDRDKHEQSKSYEHYEDLFNSIDTALMVMGADQEIKVINPAAEKILGYTKGEAVGMNFFDFFVSLDLRESLPREFKILGIAPREGPRDKVVIRRDNTENGTPRDIELYISPMEIEGELQLVAQFKDITEKLKLEQQVRDSEEKYRFLVESSPDIITKFEMENGKLILKYANKRFFELAGVDKLKDVLGMVVKTIVHRDDVNQLLKYLDNPPKEPIYAEYRSFTVKKGIRWFSNVFQCTFDSAGNFTGFHGMSRDITERKKLEQELISYKNLVETSNDLIVRTNDKFEITYANKKFLDVYGFESLNKAMGVEVIQLLHPDDLQRVAEHVRIGSKEPIEYKALTLDGRTFWASSTYVVEHDDKGLFTGMHTIGRDITHIKKTEERFRSLFENLAISAAIIDYDGYVIDINHMLEKNTGVSKSLIIGSKIQDFFPKEKKYRKRILKLLELRKSKTLQGPETYEFPVQFNNQHYDLLMAVNEIQSTDQLILTIQNLTEQKKALGALQWELDVSTTLSKLYKPLISSLTSLNEITNTILDGARKLTGSEHGYVSTIDPVTKDMVVHTHIEMMKNQCYIENGDRRIRFPHNKDGSYDGLWGYSFNTHEAFFTNSPESHPASKGIPNGHIPLTQFLSVPVMLGEELVGQIALANPGRDYTDRDLDSIRRFGEVFALAVQRNRIEKSLKESEERYKSLFQNSSLSLMLLDKHLNIIQVNRAFEELFSYSRTEIENEAVPLDHIIPGQRPRLERYFIDRAFRKKTTPQTYETVIFTKDEQKRYVSISVNLELEPETRNIILSILDITEKKQLELQKDNSIKELDDAYKAMEKQTDMINHDLGTIFHGIINALPVINQIKQDYNSVVETFSNNIQKALDLTKVQDHESVKQELNDILTGMNESIQTLDELDRDFGTYTEMIERNTRRALKLSEEIRTYVKTKTDVYEFSEHNMYDLTRVVIRDRLEELKSKRVKIKNRIPKKLDLVCDYNKIMRVLDNYITNSINYSKNGEGNQIEIGFEDEGDEYEFYVKDKGIGIDPKDIPKLDTPYTRLRIEPDVSGTGLGLAIINYIINKHGGNTHIESEGSGKGTTCYFTISKKLKAGD
jgi:PAS domain S-box-containing protein